MPVYPLKLFKHKLARTHWLIMDKPNANQLKNYKISFEVIIVVLVVILLLTVSSHIPYSGNNTIFQETNSSKALAFDLITGQTVNGHISFWFTRVNYSVYNERLGRIFVAETSTRTGYFTFTAPVDGVYYLDIDTSAGFVYSYTISPAFLGLNAVFWIGLVIALGIVLEIYIRLRNKKTDLSS
jgi:hypothetical protein